MCFTCLEESSLKLANFYALFPFQMVFIPITVNINRNSSFKNYILYPFHYISAIKASMVHYASFSIIFTPTLPICLSLGYGTQTLIDMMIAIYCARSTISKDEINSGNCHVFL
ncbi:hypothetical protein RF11_07668 [Thelohanellus kitauei]|uniref:Uncharacterized protein n=1 Tax=Thelohanellus kitauei TaxID=669202 RepID=A0A0C2JDS6_THEKT|nr:hypothetical protein RF11_07668 [Thelohanellus kitauei]